MYWIYQLLLLILLIAYADFNIKKEVVTRMFVELVWKYLARADHKGISQFFLPQFLSCFLHRICVISRNKSKKFQQR
jgi:hypothetical protein